MGKSPVMTPYTRTVVQPTAEPLSLDEVKLHLRVDGDDEDDWITPQITAARQAAENFCNRYIAEQGVEMRVPGWPYCGWVWNSPWGGGFHNRDTFLLPGSDPARDVEIKYIDIDGAEQTLDPAVYSLDQFRAPSTIGTAYNQSWPPARNEQGAIRVTYTAGYSVPGASPEPYPLPAAIRSAMLLLIGNWYENREAVNIGNITSEIPMGVQHLLQPYRLSLGV